MAGPNYVLDKGFVAGGAITQYRGVVLSATAESVTQASSAGVQALGIAQDTVISSADATNSRVADVRILGISRCIAGAAITTERRMVLDNQGRVVPAAATTAKQNQVGIALQTASAAGDHVDVLLTPGVQIDT